MLAQPVAGPIFDQTFWRLLLVAKRTPNDGRPSCAKGCGAARWSRARQTLILKVFSWQNKANGYNMLQLWTPGVGCLWRRCIYYNFNLSSSSFHFCFPNWFARCLALFFHGRSTKNGETDARFEGSTVRPRGKDWVGSEPDVHAAHLAFVPIV